MSRLEGPFRLGGGAFRHCPQRRAGITGRSRRIGWELSNAPPVTLALPVGSPARVSWRSRALGGCEVLLALLKAGENLVSLTAAADEDLFILEHRPNDAQDRLGPKIIGPVEAVH